MGGGKYLAHKGLSNSSYNFTVSTENAFVDGNVTIYSVNAGKYFVMKNDGTPDQADGTFNKSTTNYSTDYKFVEYDPRPQNGKIYYIYCDNDTRQYFYNNSGSLAVSPLRDITSAAYRFKCTVTESGYTFENVDSDGNGTEKYLKHKGLQNVPFNFEIGTANTFNVDAVTLFSYNSIGDNRNLYFVMGANGAFDQATGVYNKKTTNYSTDYIFQEYIQGEKPQFLFYPGSSHYNVTFSIDGSTISDNYSAEFTPGEITDILHADISCSAYSVKFIDNEGNYYTTDANGNLDLSVFNTKTNDFSLTAQYTLDIFSSEYGEKWVRLSNANNSTYWVGVANEATNGSVGTTNVLDYTLKHQLWCLVGTAESFTLYNYAAGEDYALNVPITGTTHANGDAAQLTNDTNGKWSIKMNGADIAILPKSNNNTTLGINMYGGNGGNLKLYYTEANNTGSYWKPQVVNVDNTLTLSTSVTGTHWGGENRVAELSFTIDGTSLGSRITASTDAKTYYIPTGKKFTLSSTTYRGYDFKGFVDADGNAQQSYTANTDNKGYALTATYSINSERTLFYSNDANGKPYRIPAITTAMNGDIIAIADNRPCGNDIGYGEVDIKCRISKDNGTTWGDEFFIANGDGRNTNEMQAGYGDAAVVADRESNRVLVMMVCGRTVCHNGKWTTEKKGDTDATEVNRIARVYGTYDEENDKWTWTDPVEVTDAMYDIFVDESGTATVPSMFIGSGRIMQSRVVKKEQYYRLYCSVWTNNGGNRVIYSDDFGETWKVLGELTDRPASSGDEPKCEELPDGTVILSSRKYNGRYFNLFTFNSEDYTTGSWDAVIASNNVTNGISYGGNSTNGEILCIDALNSKGEQVKLMLQSIPTGNDRSNVGLYYKEIDASTDYTPETFAQNWTKGMQVSYKSSCYSTMSLQADDKIAFLFEEAPNSYCIVYIPLSISDITNGTYTDCKHFATNVLSLTGVGYPTADNDARTTLQNAIDSYSRHEITATELSTAVTAYKGTTSGIKMPEDGKAYTITFSTRNSSYSDRYINFNGTTLENVVCDGNPLPKSAHFVFRKSADGKYSMVPAYDNTGKYLTYQTVTNQYTADVNDFTVEPLITTTSSNVSDKNCNNLFGYVFFKFQKRTSNNSNTGVYIMKEESGNFDNSTAPYLNTTYTSALIVKEVEYQNAPTLNAIDDIQGISAIGTFSAPFATIVPDGITAYYIKATDTDGNAQLTAIGEEEAIPANTGVLLIGNAGKYTMVPAKGETRADLSDNLLSHSAGAAKVLSESDNAYILTRVNGKTAFYKAKVGSTLAINRSFLSLSSAAQSVELRFDGLTSIEDSIENNDDNSATPIYDLSGRRVYETIKDRIYIKNNKKYIAK